MWLFNVDDRTIEVHRTCGSVATPWVFSQDLGFFKLNLGFFEELGFFLTLLKPILSSGFNCNRDKVIN